MPATKPRGLPLFYTRSHELSDPIATRADRQKASPRPSVQRLAVAKPHCCLASRHVTSPYSHVHNPRPLWKQAPAKRLSLKTPSVRIEPRKKSLFSAVPVFARPTVYKIGSHAVFSRGQCSPRDRNLSAHPATGTPVCTPQVRTRVRPATKDPSVPPEIGDRSVHPATKDPSVHPATKDPSVRPRIADPSVHPATVLPGVHPATTEDTVHHASKDPTVILLCSPQLRTGDHSVRFATGNPSVHRATGYRMRRATGNPGVHPATGYPSVLPHPNW